MRTRRGIALFVLLTASHTALAVPPPDACVPGSVVTLSGVTTPANLNGQYTQTTSANFSSCQSDVYTNGEYFIASDGVNWNWGPLSMGQACPDLLSGFLAYGPVAQNLSDSPGEGWGSVSSTDLCVVFY